MGEVISLIDYKQEKERKQKVSECKNACIKKVIKSKRKRDSNKAFFELLDMFCKKYHPDIFWEFDLFINGEKD